jgi:microcystin-dependent protein
MDPFLGEIRMFAGNFAPVGWAFCNGQVLPISQNTALFSLLGTTYGGNGTTTFALPNLQGRVAIHQGQGTGLSPYALGQTGGAENVALTTAQMPSHSHTTSTSSGAPAAQARPSSNIPGFSQSANIYSNGAGDSSFNNSFIQPSGGGQPHENVQPYCAVSFIISLQGIYPPRS